MNLLEIKLHYNLVNMYLNTNNHHLLNAYFLFFILIIYNYYYIFLHFLFPILLILFY